MVVNDEAQDGDRRDPKRTVEIFAVFFNVLREPRLEEQQREQNSLEEGHIFDLVLLQDFSI